MKDKFMDVVREYHKQHPKPEEIAHERVHVRVVAGTGTGVVGGVRHGCWTGHRWILLPDSLTGE